MKSVRASNVASGRALKHLIAGLIVTAQGDVTRVQGGGAAVATHQLRVRMKKLLALLRLCQDSVPDHTFEAARMHIRAVKNACAGNRDLVVRDHLVEKLSRRFHLAPQHPLRTRGRGCQPPSPSFLRHQLCALEQLVETMRIERLTPEQILSAHTLTYRKGRRMMKEAFDTPKKETLHRWRHRVKDLHYQTLALAHLSGSSRRVRRARKLGALLGRERDLANLAQEPAYALKRGPWSHLIQEHRSRLRERILILGRRLYDPVVQAFEHRIKRHTELA